MYNLEREVYKHVYIPQQRIDGNESKMNHRRAQMIISSHLNFIKMQGHSKQSQFGVCLQQCILLDSIALGSHEMQDVW